MASIWRGLNRWYTWIRRAGVRTDKEIAKHMEEVGMRMVLTAKAVVPVDTGKLRDSIRIDKPVIHKDKVSMKFIADAIDDRGRSYPAYVEFGTIYMPPRSYMVSSYDAHKAEFKVEVLMAVQRGMK